MSETFESAPPTAEREAILAEWKRLSDEPAPRERREIGCMTAIVAIVAALAGPHVLRWLGIELPSALKIAGGALLAIAILGGVFVGMFLVSGRYAHAYRRAEGAAGWLAQNGTGGDPVERRRQAVTLLYYAFHSDGPSTSNTIDFEKVRNQLGAALPYVVSIERVLRADVGLYPVFSDSKVRLPGSR